MHFFHPIWLANFPPFLFMKFSQNKHPTRLFGPTRFIGTWEGLEEKHFFSFFLDTHFQKSRKIQIEIDLTMKFFEMNTTVDRKDTYVAMPLTLNCQLNE